MALATVRKELNLISNLFNVARTEWKMKGLLNPLADVKKPPAWAQPNTARFNDAEQRKKLYDALEQQNQFTNKKNCSVRFSTVKAVQFALETAVRRGETGALLWSHVHLEVRYVQVVRAAHHNAEIKGGYREAPLSSAAVAILKSACTPASGAARVSRCAERYHASRARGATCGQIAGTYQISYDAPRGHKRVHGAWIKPSRSGNSTGPLDAMRRYTHPERSATLKKLG